MVAHHDQQRATLQAEVEQLKTALEKEKENSSKTLEELQCRLEEKVCFAEEWSWEGRLMLQIS